MKTAHDFADVYNDLGISLTGLGCVMLDVEPIDSSFINDDDLYVSPNPDRFWINGRSTAPHMTLKFGLLPEVRQSHVRRVIEDLGYPPAVTIQGLDKFYSPYDDEDYECIVARIVVDGAFGDGRQIMDLHNRLNFLPHVNTFPEYNPHVTIAYVKPGWWFQNSINGNIPRSLKYTTVATKGLNFGKMDA